MSKKLAKGDTTPAVKVNGEDLAAQKEKKQMLMIGAVAIFALIMIVYIVWENHHTKYLVSVNGEKVTIDEMMYDVYQVEENYGYMAYFYAQLGYGDYWSMELGENGETVQEMAKEECMESYVDGKVLYLEAVANGYELTEEDKKKAEEELNTIVKAYTEKDEESGEETVPTEVLGFTTDELKGILEERTLAARYKEDVLAGYGVTEADVVASLDKEALRQYDIEYFEISLADTEDEEGNVVELTEEEKTARYNEIKAVMEKAKKSSDWSKVIEKAEDADSEEIVVEYDTDGFIAEESIFDEETTAMIMKMANGEVTDIVEADGYYYVIRMKNNNSSERYEKEIKDAVTKKAEELYKSDYEAVKAKYNVEIFEGDWKKVQLGDLSY